MYCWYAHRYRMGRVLSLAQQPLAEGWVLHELLRWNVVGNGSSALIRRSAFEKASGFNSPPVCDGCEDLSLCLRIAEYSEFRLVRILCRLSNCAYTNSSNASKIVGSCATALYEYRLRYPEFR